MDRLDLTKLDEVELVDRALMLLGRVHQLGVMNKPEGKPLKREITRIHAEYKRRENIRELK